MKITASAMTPAIKNAVQESMIFLLFSKEVWPGRQKITDYLFAFFFLDAMKMLTIANTMLPKKITAVTIKLYAPSFFSLVLFCLFVRLFVCSGC